MDVFRTLMEDLGIGTSVIFCEDGTYCIAVLREGRNHYFYNEDPIVALEKAKEALGEG